MYYDRKTTAMVDEPLYKDGLTNALSGHSVFKKAIRSIGGCALSGRIYNRYMHSKLSYKDIAPIVNEYHIHLYPKSIQDFDTLHEFLIRNGNEISCVNNEELIAIANGKLMSARIDFDLDFSINGNSYSLAQLLGGHKLAQPFKGGLCLVYRLSMSDIQKYCFLDDGKAIYKKSITDDLVLPKMVPFQNSIGNKRTRVINIFKTKHFGPVAQIEISTLPTNGIRNEQIKEFTKGQNKGHFEFGESTIILLLQKGILLDADIAMMNKDGYEVQVEKGESIGALAKTIDVEVD
jgi:phosphatidylserine decarboxylase